LLCPYLVYPILFSFYFIFIVHFIYFILLSYDVYFLFNFHFDFYIFLLLILYSYLLFPFPLPYVFYTEFILFLIVFSTFFPLVFVRLSFIHFRSVPFTSLQVVAAFQTYFSHYSHPAALEHIVTLYPPLSHPIGCRHIARIPTPLCWPVSLLQAFFPTWNLDPWRWDRYVVPKRR
jgi:hypothetical protein